MKDEGKRSKTGHQSIGTISMRCGCGFTTQDIKAWAEHRKTAHKVR